MAETLNSCLRMAKYDRNIEQFKLNSCMRMATYGLHTEQLREDGQVWPKH
jgi:hypothetical protein